MGVEGRQGEDPADPTGLPPAKGKAGGPTSSKEGPSGEGQEKPVPSSAARSQQASSPRRLHAVKPGERARRTSGTPDRALQDLWVARLREGDAEALREVIHAFQERLTAVVSRLLRDQDAVADVVQETFTKAFYRIASFKGGSSLYTWLYRVAVNAAKDYIKMRRRRPASSFDDLPGRASLPGSETPLVEGLERRELRLQVRAAIERLPLRFRTVLALRELEGMAYTQIAEVLGVSLGTVESRLFRARRRLRVLLDPESTPSSVGRKGQNQ